MKQSVKETAPESEEQKYKQKCKELKRRITEVEESNEIATIALMRTKAATRRLRLEYAILLERLEDRATQIPSGIGGFEEMASPPTPSVLDESLNVAPTSTKSGPAKKGTKKVKLVSSNTGESTNGSSTVKQKIRDPDMPKRPTNAYLIFCDMEKEKIKKENEEKNPGVVSDLSKSMTEAWKSLDEEEKKPYYKLYIDDKVRYEKEMEVYNQKKQKDEGDGKPVLKAQITDTDTPIDTPEPVDSNVNDFDSSIVENDHEEDGGVEEEEEVEEEIEDEAEAEVDAEGEAETETEPVAETNDTSTIVNHENEDKSVKDEPTE
ncbi:uncharacterized protein RJT21DRAFT_139637 [Scheffersomyces amazonensis]|uniref:uncharacterized protein n=1 Tax=Scheffersomyces amazonensis TaxID=1078765 RepID=UPI00315D4DD4